MYFLMGITKSMRLRAQIEINLEYMLTQFVNDNTFPGTLLLCQALTNLKKLTQDSGLNINICLKIHKDEKLIEITQV